MTDLEKGILVYIDPFEFSVLKNKPGFLDKASYPEQYEKISLRGELGRFLFFRFLDKETCAR